MAGDFCYDNYTEKIWYEITGSELWKDFIKIEKNEARIQFVLEVSSKYDLQIKNIVSTKSKSVALNKKTAGNAAFKNKNYKEALMLYNDAIRTAPILEGNVLLKSLFNS